VAAAAEVDKASSFKPQSSGKLHDGLKKPNELNELHRKCQTDEESFRRPRSLSRIAAPQYSNLMLEVSMKLEV
jgi:hypothetical protein